jgi:hypothetical protein
MSLGLTFVRTSNFGTRFYPEVPVLFRNDLVYLSIYRFAYLVRRQEACCQPAKKLRTRRRLDGSSHNAAEAEFKEM